MTDSAVVREVLNGISRYRGKTIIVGPSSIGDADDLDLEFLGSDLGLLVSAGINVHCLTGKDYGGDVAAVWLKIEEALKQHKAAKVCLWCASDSIYSDRKRVDTLTAAEAALLVKEDGRFSSEVRETLGFAAKLCELGVPRVHIFNAHRRNAILEELFTGHGAGTMIYGDVLTYKRVRQASIADVLDITSLMRKLGKNSRRGLFAKQHLEEFRVFAVDGEVHGCARIVANAGAIEVSSLAHSERINATEVLEALLRNIIQEAESSRAQFVRIPLQEIPALMIIQPWFTRLGFQKRGHRPREAWVKQLGQ